MKNIPMICGCTLAVLVLLAWWTPSRPNGAAVASDGIAAVSIVASTAAMADEPHYVGTSKCRACHSKENKSWKTTKMAKAFDILKPGNAREAKEKFDIDVNKDYTKNAECLACHTTGYDHAGGYKTPDPEDAKAVRAAKKMEGAGCEACHGPGSAYIKIFRDIFKTKRKYRVEELHAAGLTKIDENSCKTCHNERCPTVKPDPPFDFQKMVLEDMHTLLPLKYREE